MFPNPKNKVGFKTTKDFQKNIFFFLLSLIFITILFSILIKPLQKPEFISLNELAGKINQQEIASIVVAGNRLTITTKDGKQFLAQKEAESSLSETLNNFGVDPAALRQVSLIIEEPSGFKYWAKVLIPAVLPVLIIGIFLWLMLAQSRKGMGQIFSFGQTRARLFLPFKQRVTFDDIANLEEAKEELQEIVDFLKHPQKYLRMGARIPKGVLLIGPPGTGKTLLARAIAGECKVPFFYLSGSEFVEIFAGVGASRVRSLFTLAKKNSPSIIFIDEIDAIGGKRGFGITGAHQEREQTLNQILFELDGFEPTTRVIVLAATNRPDVLDPALLRPGRFDRRIYLTLPDILAREKILRIHARGKILAPDVDLKKVAIRTPGFSGADLANLMNEAAILAASKNQKAITQQNLYDSIEKVILGPEKKVRVISPEEKKIFAYHEAGHALVAACLKEADKVQKVSIISRGLAGGYTLQLPTKERKLKTKTQFLANLAVLFGGYAVEQIIFKEISTGAASDLEQATRLAKLLVTKFGMSKKMAPRFFGEGVSPFGEIWFKDYSEELAAKIDLEVDRLLNQSLKRAKRIIKSHQKALKAIAEQLIEKETLEQEEFEELIKKYKIKPKSVTKIKIE